MLAARWLNGHQSQNRGRPGSSGRRTNLLLLALGQEEALITLLLQGGNLLAQLFLLSLQPGQQLLLLSLQLTLQLGPLCLQLPPRRLLGASPGTCDPRGWAQVAPCRPQGSKGYLYPRV